MISKICKGKNIDTTGKFHIYKAAKLGIQLYDKHKIFNN
jgi:hypothetical protein